VVTRANGACQLLSISSDEKVLTISLPNNQQNGCELSTVTLPRTSHMADGNTAEYFAADAYVRVAMVMASAGPTRLLPCYEPSFHTIL